VVRAAAISLLCLAPLAAGCGKSDKKKADRAVTRQQLGTPSAHASQAGCRKVSPPKPKGPGHMQKPKGKLDASRKWSLTVGTNCGSFTIALDVKDSPNTSASLVSLARKHFYDGSAFQRIVPGFVIQGGDPSGTGEGDAGYTTVDKPPASATYTRGVVAMARSDSDPPGAGGSQFFVVTGQDAGLRPDYSVVGRVAKGLDVVARIGALGDPASGPQGTPTETVVIERMTVGH
jgi:cyclophilin family peptidyl-prolyl cis-trans isomerase